MDQSQSMNYQALDLPLDDESLMELCASESTLGGSGQYREAGVGRFL
ncbi:hypothetical protein IHE31_10975 [Mycetohabitans rhizoxinica]|nr:MULTISPECIES: burhizin family lasso peptide [Mycetohabitans]MCF7696025.1 hypothetical protein [Mycetohabitans sp. B2]MCG1047364.1 hypothetical protein [Mycetohabitans sp. B6]QGY72963.1 lasso peptide precursor peptide A [Mycetohabitans sp.]QGY73005.1 lasso peptide precursor peptide A [Mycetohabitans sp.]